MCQTGVREVQRARGRPRQHRGHLRLQDLPFAVVGFCGAEGLDNVGRRLGVPVRLRHRLRRHDGRRQVARAARPGGGGARRPTAPCYTPRSRPPSAPNPTTTPPSPRWADAGLAGDLGSSSGPRRRVTQGRFGPIEKRPSITAAGRHPQQPAGTPPSLMSTLPEVAAGCPPRGRPAAPRPGGSAAATRRPARPATTAPGRRRTPSPSRPAAGRRHPAGTDHLGDRAVRRHPAARHLLDALAAPARRTPRGRSRADHSPVLRQRAPGWRRGRPRRTDSATTRPSTQTVPESGSRPHGRASSHTTGALRNTSDPAPAPTAAATAASTGSRAGPYDASSAARWAASSPAAATSAPTRQPVARPRWPTRSDHQQHHRADHRLGHQRPAGGERQQVSGDQPRPAAAARPTATARAARPPGRAAPRRRSSPLTAAPVTASGCSSGPHPRQLGAAGQPVQHLVEGAGTAPRHDRAAARGRARSSRRRARCAASARPGRPPAGRCPRAPAAPASVGQGVDHEHREPAPVQRSPWRVPIASASIGDSTITTVPAVARNCSRSVGVVAQARRPHGGQPVRGSGAGAAAPAPYPTCSPLAPTTRSATRSPLRTKCSASAEAARIVRSRLLGRAVDAAGARRGRRARRRRAARRCPPRPRVVTTCSVAGAQRDPPVDPPQPVAGVEGPDPGELGAVADPARAVRADQPERLRRLGARCRTAPSSAAHVISAPRRAPGPSGSRPRGWSAPPSPRRASAGPSAAG